MREKLLSPELSMLLQMMMQEMAPKVRSPFSPQ